MSIRDTAAQFGLDEIRRPGVTVYTSPEDYAAKTGKAVPVYNPDLPNKYWAWGSVPRGTRFVTFLVPVIRDGEPVLESVIMPVAYAQTVNIPYGQANAEAAYSSETLPAPVEALRPDEYLALGFAGLIVVRNRARFQEPVRGFEMQVLDMLREIARKLGV